MQVYREEARYLERTAPWVERIGLSYVKQRVVEDEIGRKALYRRFLDSQEIYQFDPWEQRARGVDKHEFTVMRQVGA
jgi:nitrite reductase (NADH) large subunit